MRKINYYELSPGFTKTKRYLLLCLMIVLCSTLAFSQVQTVTGKILDNDGQPIPGANILEKGTANGTVTDASGNYTISVSGANAILVVSFIGFKSQEVAIAGRYIIDVSLVPDITSLQEVVVTGYTTENRRNVSGAVSTVKAHELTVVPSGNVEQQLQGRVPGVTVISNGQPGSTSQIRVRGFGSFGDNRPLYIVDGYPVQSIDFLSPDDIESTTVLKDAASASIYGSRASSGVIVYTTKQGGRNKKLSVTYDAMFGFTDPGKGQSMLGPSEFADWTWNAQRNTQRYSGSAPTFSHPQFGNGSTPVLPDYLEVGNSSGVVGSVDLTAERANYNVTDFNKPIYQVVAANKSGTDWYKAITHNAPITRQSIGISGGGENSRYYFGFSMQDQDGVLNYQKFKRYTFRVNSEFDLIKGKLRIGENLQFTYRQTRVLLGGSGGQGVSADENIILTAFRMPSIIPIYDAFGGYAGTRAKGFNNPKNPVANLDRQSSDRGFGAFGLGNIYLEFEPIKGLVARTSIGGNYGSSYFWSYFAREYENSENNSAVSYNEGASQSFGWTYTNTLTYKKQLNNHVFDVLLGQEALNTGDGRNIAGSGQNPFTEDRDFVTLSTTQPGTTRTVGRKYFKGVRFLSLFGKVNYAYDNKYLASVTLRRDGSSRFGSANRYGVFPAFSLGWRISSEAFMSQFKWIDDLKIRGGWGIMGNSNSVDPNNQYSLYTTNVGNSSYPIAGTGAAEGYYRNRIGNPYAKWEKAITTNVGFDGSFFGGKLDVVFDVWRKETQDLLFQVPITVGTGFYASAPFVNIGKMVNKGVDIQVINRGNITEGLKYEVTVNGGFLKNEIVSVAPGINYLTTVNPSFRGITPIRNQVGQSISAFYGYQVAGIFQNQGEVDAAALQAGVVRSQESTPTSVAQGEGRFKYADRNGDGVIDDKDRTFLGSPVPKFNGGINFKITYKGFELESYMYAALGHKIFNQSKWFTDFYPSFAGAAISSRVTGSWTPQNPGASIPIFENVSNFSTNTTANSFYVENGSYFRMQNITLAYNLPSAILSRAKLTKARVFASTNNVFTITKYQGLDPSVGGNSDTNFGIDVGNYPITRSWTFGVNLGF